MGQKQWLIFPQTPKEHLIGLYHGDSTGHVVLYVDQKIILVKFNQEVPQSYSFYINDILFEVEIKKLDNEFLYELTDKSPEIINAHLQKLSLFQRIKYWFS